MQKEYKKNKLDLTLAVTTLLLVGFGTLVIMSATGSMDAAVRIARTHFIAVSLSAVAFLFGWSFNYQIYRDQSKILYGLIIVVLAAVLLFGTADRGSKSWFKLSFFSVQPVEVCRIALIMVMAAYLDKGFNKLKKAGAIFGALLIIVPVFFLIMKQPDFSSLLVTFPSIIAMIYCAGGNLFYLFSIIGYGFIAVIFTVLWTFIGLHPVWIENNSFLNKFYSLSSFGIEAGVFCILILIFGYTLWWFFDKFKSFIPKAYFLGAALVVIAAFLSGMLAYNQMKNYQRKRLEVFLSPATDIRGAGYNLRQAKIAMGSGGFLGKGFFSGTQSRLGFLPERHTDFIMAVVGEEGGFLASSFILILYMLLLWRILRTAMQARDRFGYFLTCGIFTMFGVYLFINMGMNLGIVPIAGLPLPFISYGGSNLVASCWAVGIVQSVYSKRMALA